MIEFTVVIPAYNDAVRLEKCLKALSQQTLPSDKFIVKVIDNNSIQDLKSIVERFRFAEYLFEAKAGSYAARNNALDNINTPFIAFTDSDCIPQENWLECALSTLRDSGDGVGAIGGKVMLFAENERPNLCEYYDMVTGFDQQSYIEKDGFSVTANLIVKRSALTKTGVFNALLMSSGDKDWCLRMQQQGLTLVYCKQAIVAHPARNSVKQIKTKLKRLFGGFYHNHKYVEPNPLFSLLGLIKAALPPIQNLKQMQKLKHSLKLSVLTQLKLFGFFYYLKLYTLVFRLRLILGLVKQVERL
ncbi:glycosyltransferase [uncultured Paraglaciecola sp.]|uniref:glycosyltransferase n=1 Tax=uncultured Paraglaciecola sp. TaxID=1765024 RepID=UPI0030DCD867|tara:strand:+ start:61623 stop:62525 length:903 start_codon:yes stop_codon:yes gene_type:complete